MNRRIPALALVLGALVGGCSDDGGDEAASPTTTSSSDASSTTTSTTEPSATTTSVAPAPVPAPIDLADAASAARRLADAEAVVRGASGDLAAAAKAQQAAYRAIAAHPEWDAEVRRLLPTSLHGALDANVTAARELRSLTKPRSSLPEWRIVAPAPADELLGYYRAAEREFGVPWTYLAAIHLVETRMGRIRGVSSAGAQGPMQFMPATWEAYGGGGNVESNRDAIFAAARYLKANGAPADMETALWNYNHSDRYVRAVSLYAREMQRDERAYRAYWHWDVYYRLTTGDLLLPVGWTRS